MLAKKYKSKLISIVNHFEGIYSLEFKSLGRPFKYKPGEFLHLAIDEEYDGICQWPESRCFSMQSNPNEKHIIITYAVKGNFTQQMEQSLQIGSEVWLKLPYGELFSQSHSKENTVFIAGGTGITPFLSLFLHESFYTYSNPRIYLGFRSKDFNIYHNELNNLCSSSSLISVYYEDKQGIIDIHSIISENESGSSYFISGPPSMIRAFKQFLVDNNVPKENVLTDDWE